MHQVSKYFALGLTVLLAASFSTQAAEPPEIPVGFDAYRQWDLLPRQRIGARAYMRSTYDRDGNNRSADSSHFLYQERDDFNVTLDVEGQGILYFARYNHWHGSPWHYEVDGNNYIVKETTTANPLKKLTDSVFLPEKPFPSPLTFTYATTKGADLMWVPIGFDDRFRMAYSRTFYGTGYYIYHLYAPGANLSQSIEPWNLQSVPPQDVLDLLNQAGTDIAPRANKESQQGVQQHEETISLASGATETVAALTGSSTIRAIKFDMPGDQASDFDDVWLRITWDGRDQPSVDAPLSLFFGTGTFFNPAGKEYVVKALPMNVRFAEGRMQLACYFPMPYFQSAKVELVNKSSTELGDIRCEIRTEPYDQPPHEVGYFHATYVDHADPALGEDLVFLDTNEVEGGGPWSGNFVGTSFIFSHRGELRTLEGDPRFFFDDSQTPQAQGTGTEEWGGGGDYWGGKTMTLPLAGHPMGKAAHPNDPDHPEFQNPKRLIESAYRYLIADLMPFGRRAVIRFEHGAINNFPEHYQSVTYWYGAPFATLELVDTLKVGDSASEASHDYVSPDASEPYEVTSRYELGPDQVPLEGELQQAKPDHYADFEFEVQPNRDYYIWLRGRSSEGIRSDATWFQFDREIDSVNDFYATGAKGLGNWRDKAAAGEWSWSSSLPDRAPEKVRFSTGGIHRLRVQRRHGPHEIDQIWLSTSQQATPNPDFRAEPAEDHSEIVLTAKDATTMKGDFSAVEQGDLNVLRVGERDMKAWLEVFPATTKTGRKTTTFSEFTLEVGKENWGVMLRRTLDYQYPNQRAKVFVATSLEEKPDWKPAGIWYLAGSNTFYYSRPSGPRRELGKSDPIVMTSNRRFRDDEFLLSHELTRGHDKIRVRVEFTRTNTPLLPGREVDDQAWSEIEYNAYRYVLPEWTP